MMFVLGTTKHSSCIPSLILGNKVILYCNNNSFIANEFAELYNSAIQTIERNSHKNQDNEQVLCMHDFVWKVLCVHSLNKTQTLKY